MIQFVNKSKAKPAFLLAFTCLLCVVTRFCLSQKICPNCGSMEVPYPLSTDPNCGDANYHLRCDYHLQKLYFDSLNGSSYPVLRIMASYQRMVVQPSPWVAGRCVTKDMVESEGLWLNHTLPFNVTSSNTIFLLHCSPRLFLSPLNCTPSSLCHEYLETSGRVDRSRAAQCANTLRPCCTFVAGGLPSAYKIRLHDSGCTAFRSILNLDPDKPANKWEEGLEIQWKSPPEPSCKTQLDCSGASKCLPFGENGLFRCLCHKGYYWDPTHGGCLQRKYKSKSHLTVGISAGLILLVSIAGAASAITIRKCSKPSKQAKLAKEREDIMKSSNIGGKTARMFPLKEIKKATKNFSRDRILGIGGYGEVYKGELQDGTLVAIKAAKVGNLKSTQQILNEVEILSQVNHKNLVKLLGCCVESDQPLMISEYIPNGTLHEHLEGKFSTFLNWEKRLRIAFQTAEALAYLHSGTYTPIYHRDVKSRNILLDKEFNAKVSDFGLSRLALPGLSHVSTCAQGTVGYLDPEYYRNYQLNNKSDVYSYGVVLLELLTSQKAIDFSRNEDNINLAIYASQSAKSGAIMEVVDQRLLAEDPSSNTIASLHIFLELAFACLKEKKADRPTMNDVVQQLECIIHSIDQQKIFINEFGVKTS